MTVSNVMIVKQKTPGAQSAFSAFGFSPLPSGAILAGHADGMQGGFVEQLSALKDWEQVATLAGVSPIMWIEPRLAKLNGASIAKAYNLSGNPAYGMAPLTTAPKLDVTASNQQLIDFYDEGAAASTAARLATPKTPGLFSGSPGLTVLATFDMQAPGGDERRILDISFVNGSGSVTSGLIFRRTSNGRLGLSTRRVAANSLGTMEPTAGTLASGFHFAAATVDAATGSGHLFLDGAEIAATSALWTTGSGNTWGSTWVQAVVGGSDTVNGGFRLGRMVVLPKALTSEQIGQIRQRWRTRLPELPA